MKQSNPEQTSLHTSLIRATRAHYIYVLAYVIQIIAYDAAKLITRELVFRRWVAAALFLTAVVAIWYVARTRIKSTTVYKLLVLALVSVDIAFACYQVYTQRGMASRAVLLYIVPIAVAGILANRSAIFGTAALCIAAYTTTAVGYFYFNFNEGYKVELYGEIGFYSAMFIVTASLVWLLVRHKKHR